MLKQTQQIFDIQAVAKTRCHWYTGLRGLDNNNVSIHSISDQFDGIKIFLQKQGSFYLSVPVLLVSQILVSDCVILNKVGFFVCVSFFLLKSTKKLD